MFPYPYYVLKAKNPQNAIYIPSLPNMAMIQKSLGTIGPSGTDDSPPRVLLGFVRPLVKQITIPYLTHSINPFN